MQLRATLAARWWTLVLRGAVAILFGAAMLVWPDASLVVLVVFIGAWFVADGLLTLVLAFKHGRKSLQIADCSVSLAIGAIAMLQTDMDGLTLLALVAMWATARGLLQILFGVELGAAHRGAWIFVMLGAASLALAAALLSNMAAGALASLPLIAWFAVLLGVCYVAVGFWLERANGSAERHELPPRAAGR